MQYLDIVLRHQIAYSVITTSYHDPMMDYPNITMSYSVCHCNIISEYAISYFFL